MNSKFEEKIAICYIACGPTYRETLLERLNETYFDDENLFYFILTDKKSHFDNLPFTNLCVKELKDYYEEFPEIVHYERLIEADDKNEYAEEFMKTNYRFPFSIIRFLFLEAVRKEITNILLIVADTWVRFENFTNDYLKTKNRIYNAVSEWDEYVWNNDMSVIASLLQKRYGLIVDKTIRVLDACARLFVFEKIEDAQKFFNIWHEIMVYIYTNNLLRLYAGSYANNDEFILAPIYNAFRLNLEHQHSGFGIFEVNHNPLKERFWHVPGSEIMSHTNYEEFLKINNLQDGKH